MMPTRRLCTLSTAFVLLASLFVAGCDSAGPNGAPSSAVPPEDAEPGVWSRVATATDNTIRDVAITSEGAYAVAEGGLLLKRTPQEWTTVVDGGVSGNGNDLFGLAVTESGDRLWLVGASGAVGEYDVTTGSLTDRSQPVGSSNNYNDVAVTGSADTAHVYVAGDSGKLFYTFENGREGTWNEVTPGSGAALNAVDFFAPRAGHLVDGNQSVFETDDGGTWTGIGIADADVDFQAVDSDGPETLWVAGGSGMVYRWDGTEWTPSNLGDAGLQDLEVNSNEATGLAVGGDGAVFAYDGTTWTPEDTPTTQNLHAVVLATDTTSAIAVGAGGTILEK